MTQVGNITAQEQTETTTPALFCHRDRSKSIFNLTKFHVLYAIDFLDKQGITANSKTIRQVTRMNSAQVCNCLNRLEMFYITKKHDKEHVMGCLFKYELSKKGRERLAKMKLRFDNNVVLNLRGLHYDRDWTEYEILPGIDKQHYKWFREAKLLPHDKTNERELWGVI